MTWKGCPAFERTREGELPVPRSHETSGWSRPGTPGRRLATRHPTPEGVGSPLTSGRFPMPAWPASAWRDSSSGRGGDGATATSDTFAAVTSTARARPVPASTPACALYPKCQLFPFLAWWASGSRERSRFLAGEGDPARVASTTGPRA